MKRILCSNPDCGGVFAHQLGSRTIDIVRGKQQFTVTGNNFSVTGTCGQFNSQTRKECLTKNALIVEDGKLDESDIQYKSDSPPDPPPNPPADPPPGDKKYTQ